MYEGKKKKNGRKLHKHFLLRYNMPRVVKIFYEFFPLYCFVDSCAAFTIGDIKNKRICDDLFFFTTATIGKWIL